MKNGIIFILIVVIVAIVGSVLKAKKDTWSGYFYPDGNDLTNWITAPETFNTFEYCRSWALEQAQILNLSEMHYDYECGLNCKIDGGLNVCEETRD